ncbi:MAG TPA: sulfur carrier protein ThiS [Opitutaceae bacterium]|nr:sulfur carrier protein ThiS [Opitutaceae bacterium]
MSQAATTSVIYVNDQPRPLAAPATLLALLGELGLAGRKGVAVALNGAVVPRGDWPARALAAADRVLVIQATQGG